MEQSTITGWDNEKRPVERGYSPAEVQEYCVRHTQWQVQRFNMKGKPTHIKLQMLEEWYDKRMLNPCSELMTSVQVGNYLGALRRGGQLDANNQIRKFI